MKEFLSYENKVLKSVFDSRSSDVEYSHVNDRFAKVEGMHAVSPSMIGIYMPLKFDFGIGESKFIYGPKQSKNSKFDAKTRDLASCESNSSVETFESVPKPVESKLKAVSEPKVWSDAPIIKEYESESDDEYMFKATVEQEITSCAFINTVKHVKSPRKSVKDQDTCSQNPNDNPHRTLKGNGIVDSGCSRHMTGNKDYLVEYQDFNGGPVAFRGSKGQITGKGKIRIRKLDFEEVYFVKELQHFNLFYVSQMCDKKNKPVTVENKANKTAGLKEANNSIEAKNRDQQLNGDTGLKTNKEPVDQNDQAFLEELERLKRQEKEADDAAETLRKMFAQGTEDFLLQAGAARASSTNCVNTASTPVNTASTPVNTASTLVNSASPSRNVSVAEPSYPDLLTYANQDDSPIPSLEDIYEVPNDGIFTSASYDAEGAMADFTNLESTVNVSLIPQSKIHFIHPTTQILKDSNSAVQTRSKVNKSSKAHAFTFYHVFIHLGNFNKPDDIVDKGDDYVVNEGRSTDKIKVLNAEAKRVSVAGETLSTATLAVSTASVQPLRKCLVDEAEYVPLADIVVDEKLGYVEEPIEIFDTMVKKLRRKEILIFKVRWKHIKGLDYTREPEEELIKYYLSFH
nr:reverse transcriptase domain-containing protein [Tanacetum cinerariifolium]